MNFSFHKKERLRLKRAFNFLFSNGASFKRGLLKFYYVFDIPEELIHAPVSIAFAAPKRSFKRAVHRNLIKRRMREAYRLHKHEIIEQVSHHPYSLALLVKYQKPYLKDYRSIERDMVKGIEKLQQLHLAYLDEKSSEKNPKKDVF